MPPHRCILVHRHHLRLIAVLLTMMLPYCPVQSAALEAHLDRHNLIYLHAEWATGATWSNGWAFTENIAIIAAAGVVRSGVPAHTLTVLVDAGSFRSRWHPARLVAHDPQTGLAAVKLTHRIKRWKPTHVAHYEEVPPAFALLSLSPAGAERFQGGWLPPSHQVSTRFRHDFDPAADVGWQQGHHGIELPSAENRCLPGATVWTEPEDLIGIVTSVGADHLALATVPTMETFLMGRIADTGTADIGYNDTLVSCHVIDPLQRIEGITLHTTIAGESQESPCQFIRPGLWAGIIPTDGTASLSIVVDQPDTPITLGNRRNDTPPAEPSPPEPEHSETIEF